MGKFDGASRSEWQTPEWILSLVREVFGGPIELDPASSEANPTKAKRFYTPAENGLVQPWNANKIFLNPPWSRRDPTMVRLWMKRAREVRQLTIDPDAEMIICCAGSVNSHWFHDYVADDADAIFFPRGRVCYVPPNPEESQYAPNFDTAVLYYGKYVPHFAQVFGLCGIVVAGIPWTRSVSA